MRVEFVKRSVELFITKERLNINPKKIYQSDGYAVQELLKIAQRLYKAQQMSNSNNDLSFDQNLKLKLQNLKNLKLESQEITESGAKLYNLLGQEEDLKKARENALIFLDNINKQNDHDSNFIKNSVKNLIENQKLQINSTQIMVENLKGDESKLEEKIRIKQTELEKVESRVKSLQSVRPAFMDELERLQIELEELYSDFVIKYRNLD